MTEVYRIYGEPGPEMARARRVIEHTFNELVLQRDRSLLPSAEEFAAAVMAHLVHAQPPMLIATLDHVSDPVELSLLGHYVSTYCQHAARDDKPELHEVCRLNCKIEKEPCRCPCHENSPITEAATELSDS